MYKYCVICAQHIDIDIHFSQREYYEFEHETWHDLCLIMMFYGCEENNRKVRNQMHCYVVKHDLHFAAILNTLQRCFYYGSESHYIKISEISLQRKMN